MLWSGPRGGRCYGLVLGGECCEPYILGGRGREVLWSGPGGEGGIMVWSQGGREVLWSGPGGGCCEPYILGGVLWSGPRGGGGEVLWPGSGGGGRCYGLFPGGRCYGLVPGGGSPCNLSHHAFGLTSLLSSHQLRLNTCAAAYIVLSQCMLG